MDALIPFWHVHKVEVTSRQGPSWVGGFMVRFSCLIWDLAADSWVLGIGVAPADNSYGFRGAGQAPQKSAKSQRKTMDFNLSPLFEELLLYIGRLAGAGWACSV
jgi:hypothetical protein